MIFLAVCAGSALIIAFLTAIFHSTGSEEMAKQGLQVLVIIIVLAIIGTFLLTPARLPL